MIDTDTTEDTPLAAEGWRVTDEGSAAWAADKVLSARQRLARVKAACQAMIADAEREVERCDGFFLPLLAEWAQANPPRKGRTIRLTTGALAFRTVPGGPRVTDEAAALDWALANLPAAVKVTTKVLATPIKEHVAKTGEAVPGVEIVEARESFDVKEV